LGLKRGKNLSRGKTGQKEKILSFVYVKVGKKIFSQLIDALETRSVKKSCWGGQKNLFAHEKPEGKKRLYSCKTNPVKGTKKPSPAEGWELEGVRHRGGSR